MEIISKVRRNIHYCVGLLILLIGQGCFAETVIIQPNTPIAISKTYHDLTLDLRSGSFLITHGATLTIRNCNIVGTISKNNPILFNVDSGKLDLRKNTAKINAVGIAPHPTTQSLYYVIQVADGNVNLQGNSFTVDDPSTVGFLITLWTFGTSGFNIVNNTFEKFHGAIYLINSGNAIIAKNIFIKNTYGNIVNIGNNNKITQNTIYFSGNNRLGNAIDILNSDDVTVSKNLLLTPTCHGIYVLSSRNVLIDGNRVEGGITYAINVLSFPEKADKFAYLGTIAPPSKLKSDLSNKITITNNFMSQNRYGIAATDVEHLTVDHNYFIQRFDNNDARKFWTNNAILLTKVKGLVWTNNLYKEAFTQDIQGDNSKSFNFVPFPVTGGISL